MADMTSSERLLYQKDIPVLLQEIHTIYAAFDKRFGLRGADLPVFFKNEESELGSYIPESDDQEEGFTFSLYYIAYSSKHALSKEDKWDLFRHEYAHYMNRHMEIPKEYLFEPGIHGSSWRYCASLVGAVPSAYYKVGESIKKQDYALEKKKVDHEKARALDTHRREVAYQKERDSVVRFQVGDKVKHQKFGEGIIEQVEPVTGSVRLHIRFKDGVKKLDQKWVMKSQLK